MSDLLSVFRALGCESLHVMRGDRDRVVISVKCATDASAASAAVALDAGPLQLRDGVVSAYSYTPEMSVFVDGPAKEAA